MSCSTQALSPGFPIGGRAGHKTQPDHAHLRARFRRPVPSITQTRSGPASPGSGLRRSPPGPLPSHPVLAVRWVRDLPSGLFLGSQLRPWLPGQPAFLHWVSFLWGRYPGDWPALPWDRLLPTPPCPSARALCLGGGAGDQRLCRRREERRWSPLWGCKIWGVVISLGPTVGLGKWWGAWKSLPSPPFSTAGLVRPPLLPPPPSISRSPGSGPPGTQADGPGTGWQLSVSQARPAPGQPLG